MRDKTCCFTGHREILGDIEILASSITNIVESLILKGYRFFGAGGARGFDNLAGSIVLNLKKKYPFIHLILVLPFVNQYEHESGWIPKEIEQYQYLKKHASKVVHLQEHYSSGCYYRRNRHLVDHSSLCISYQYKNSGGTAYTTRYAESKNIPVINSYHKE